MKKESTPEQRAAQHVSTMCPACHHEIKVGTSRYDGIHIGSHEVCPWCETMLVVASMTVTCEVDFTELPAAPVSQGNEIPARTPADAAEAF